MAGGVAPQTPHTYREGATPRSPLFILDIPVFPTLDIPVFQILDNNHFPILDNHDFPILDNHDFPILDSREFPIWDNHEFPILDNHDLLILEKQYFQILDQYITATVLGFLKMRYVLVASVTVFDRLLFYFACASYKDTWRPVKITGVWISRAPSLLPLEL